MQDTKFVPAAGQALQVLLKAQLPDFFLVQNSDFSLNLFCRTEIFYPSMRALAKRMGKQRDYEVLILDSHSLQPPSGALEVDVKTFQVATLSLLLC